MLTKPKENHLRNPTCLALCWFDFRDEEFTQDKRVFYFLRKVIVPELLDITDLKYFLKDEIKKVVYTNWSINSIVFIDPPPVACACLVKYIYTDFGQIKHQTAFYVGDSVNKKVWLIR
jgi:hypothetical protein